MLNAGNAIFSNLYLLFGIGIALTSFLTGITEPIEFLFVFLSPALYFIHAVLSDVALAVTQLLGSLHGFGFSAGLIDYWMNFYLSTNGWLLIPIGLVFAVIYYFVFYYAIVKWDIPTPGRLDDEEGDNSVLENMGISALGQAYYDAIGGKDNFVSVDACITRLRLTINDASKLDEAAIKKLGATGIVKPSKKNVQIVVGTHAELIADEINKVNKSK